MSSRGNRLSKQVSSAVIDRVFAVLTCSSVMNELKLQLFA